MPYWQSQIRPGESAQALVKMDALKWQGQGSRTAMEVITRDRERGGPKLLASLL
jgi:hypothetical protein